MIARALATTWLLFLLTAAVAMLDQDRTECVTDAECEALHGPDEPCWGYPWECPPETEQRQDTDKAGAVFDGLLTEVTR